MIMVWRGSSGFPAERGRWEEKTWTASGRVYQFVGVRGRAGRVLGVATPSFILELRSLIGTRPLWLSVAVALVVDGENRILLGRRADSGAWALPGSIIEPGEEPADAAARECFEETGVVVVPEAVSALTVSPGYDVRERRPGSIPGYHVPLPPGGRRGPRQRRRVAGSRMVPALRTARIERGDLPVDRPRDIGRARR